MNQHDSKNDGTPNRQSETEHEITETLPQKAWDSFLDFIHQRVAQAVSAEPYIWRREDAYTHLDQFNPADDSDSVTKSI